MTPKQWLHGAWNTPNEEETTWQEQRSTQSFARM